MLTAALAISAYAVGCSSVVLFGSPTASPSCIAARQVKFVQSHSVTRQALWSAESPPLFADCSRERLSSFIRCRLRTRGSRDGRSQRYPGYRREPRRTASNEGWRACESFGPWEPYSPFVCLSTIRWLKLRDVL